MGTEAKWNGTGRNWKGFFDPYCRCKKWFPPPYHSVVIQSIYCAFTVGVLKGTELVLIFSPYCSVSLRTVLLISVSAWSWKAVFDAVVTISTVPGFWVKDTTMPESQFTEVFTYRCSFGKALSCRFLRLQYHYLRHPTVPVPRTFYVWKLHDLLLYTRQDTLIVWRTPSENWTTIGTQTEMGVAHWYGTIQNGRKN